MSGDTLTVETVPVGSRDTAIVFHVEPADRSVGIMAEGFSARDARSETACECYVADCAAPMTFRWEDDDTGEVCAPPPNRLLIEGALRGFVEAWYAQASYGVRRRANRELLP